MSISTIHIVGLLFVIVPFVRGNGNGIFLSIAYVLVFTGIWQLLREQKVRRYSKHSWPLFIFIVLVTTSLLGAYPLNLKPITSLLVVMLAIPLLQHVIRQQGPKLLLVTLVGVAVLHAQWGILQFALQQDLSQQYLNEPELSAEEPGIAKFSITTQKAIRATGPYSHANVFGGTLAIALLASCFMPKKYQHFTVLFITLGLLTSFSRSAWLSVAIIFALFFAMKHRTQTLLMILASALLFIPLINARLNDVEDRAIPERQSGYEWAIDIIKTQPIWQGAGIGNYKIALESYLTQNNISHQSWQIAPAHNVFLLLIVEWGVVATTVLISLLVWILGFRIWVFTIPLFPLLLLDHYLLTEPAPLLFALATILGARNYLPHTDQQIPSVARNKVPHT